MRDERKAVVYSASHHEYCQLLLRMASFMAIITRVTVAHSKSADDSSIGDALPLNR